MTPEQAKEFWPLVRTFAEGKTIQCRSASGAWIDLAEVNFDGTIGKWEGE